MSTDQKTQKKVQVIVGNLSKPEAKTQIQAIKDLKVHGNKTVIEPLVSLYVVSANNVVLSEIEGLLNTVKAEDVQETVIDCLMDPNFESAQQMLLASIWNSNLDYSDYLTEIVDTAINGDFMLAMECLTIFENMEAELTEEKIMSPLLSLNQYLNDNLGEESPKHSLLTEIAIFLNHVSQSL